MRAYLFKIDNTTGDCNFMKASICMHISLSYSIMEQYILEDSFDYKEVIRKNLAVTRRNYTSNKSLRDLLKRIRQRNLVANIKELNGIALICTRIKDGKSTNQYLIICCEEFKWSKDMFDLGFDLVKNIKKDSFSFKQYLCRKELIKGVVTINKGDNTLNIVIDRVDNYYTYQVIKVYSNKQYLYEFDIFDKIDSKKVYEI